MITTGFLGRSARHGALPLLGGTPARGFLAHAFIALAMLTFLNVLALFYVPFQIKALRDNYLIFFYHFPSAINTFLFYAWLLGSSIMYLKRRDPVWDLRGRVAAEVGVLSNTVLLATGMTWAKAAWGHWWIWNDPRLLSAAVMSLVYVGYLVLQRSIEEDEKRCRFAAVYGIAAFVNVPFVHYAIKMLGEQHHPMQLDQLGSDTSIIRTRWYGVLAFFSLYLLVYRWRFDKEFLRLESTEATARVRALEDKVAHS
jgi:heme exporter protein C